MKESGGILKIPLKPVVEDTRRKNKIRRSKGSKICTENLSYQLEKYRKPNLR